MLSHEMASIRLVGPESPSNMAFRSNAFKAPIRKEYEDFQGAYNFASNLWIDSVIEPCETRDVMALMLDVTSRRPKVDTKFGVFRM